MALLWLSFPPVGISYLAWFALTPLIHLIVTSRQLARSDYRKIWFAGLLYWLATFYFIPIPHPALWLGWLVISLYLAFYLPVFVQASRTMRIKLRIPFIIAIPVSWVGLELLRLYLFTGMGLVCLSHSQYEFPTLIQVADLSGAYTLSFAMVFVCTGLALSSFILMTNARNQAKLLRIVAHIGCSLLVLAAVISYGTYKLDSETAIEKTKVNIGLIQGSIDTVFPTTQEEAREYQKNKTDHYQQLTIKALQEWGDVDLLIWPENGWPVPDLHPDTDKSKMEREYVNFYEDIHIRSWASMFRSGKTIPPMLVGAETYEHVKDDRYGSAIFMDEFGTVTGRYYKNHLVMCGEYVPLAEYIPLLRRVPAIGKGLVAGTKSVVFDVAGTNIAPNICFESTVPQYIRKQVNSLADDANEPNILINLTNDGWFYGTSCLDFHLACNVFRAVEMRKPMLVCANTGLSAHIDAKGQIVQRGPRGQPDTILATVQSAPSDSIYRSIGDWIPITFACLTLLCAFFGIFIGQSTLPE